MNLDSRSPLAASPPFAAFFFFEPLTRLFPHNHRNQKKNSTPASAPPAAAPAPSPAPALGGATRTPRTPPPAAAAAAAGRYGPPATTAAAGAALCRWRGGCTSRGAPALTTGGELVRLRSLFSPRSLALRGREGVKRDGLDWNPLEVSEFPQERKIENLLCTLF